MNQIGLLWLVFDLPDQGSERDARTTEDEFAEPQAAKILGSERKWADAHGGTRVNGFSL